MRTLLLILSLTTTAMAQRPARGVFQYQVDGNYMGEAMEPWSATTQVTDSAGTFFITHTVHHGTGARFEYHYLHNRSAEWLNETVHGRHTCSLDPVNGVPDFALPFALAATDLAADRTFHLTVVRCLEAGVERIPVTAAAKPESGGWIVTGSPEYPFSVTISADGRVLKFVQPQGTVGTATYTLQ